MFKVDSSDDDSSSSSSSSSDDFNAFGDKITNHTGPQSVSGGENFEDEHKEQKEKINKLYDQFPVVVEGPEFTQDHSFFLMHKNDDMASLENGILLDGDEPMANFEKEKEERAMDMEFRILNRICHTMVHFQGLYREHSQDFKAQNRYNDVLPYKHNLVEVKDSDGNPIYVNGSYINIPIRNTGEKAFIAASAPVDKSLNNFWEMIYQNKTTLIIMLCNLKESSHQVSSQNGIASSSNSKVCSSKYWDEDETKEFGNISVKLINQTEIGIKIVKRELELRYKNQDDIVTITQLHHTNWPDDNAPFLDENDDIDLLIGEVAKHRAASTVEQSDQVRPSPVLVHCSAGIGRTGAFICLCSMVEVLEVLKNKTHTSLWTDIKGGDEIDKIVTRFHDLEKLRISIFGTVRKVKEQRFGMVKTQKQYEFLYNYMQHYLSKLNLG